MQLRLDGVDAVGFDLDGTLMDHLSAARVGATAMITAAGIEPTPALLELWFVVETRHFSRWLAGDVELQQHRRDRIGDMYAAMGLVAVSADDADAAFGTFRAAYGDAWRAYPEVIETLERLRAEGIAIGVLTNGPAEQQHDKLVRTGIAPYIDVVCATDEIGFAKPAPEAFDALLTKLGTSAERTLFIGDDATADIEGARGAGIRAARVRAAGRGIAELSSAIRRAAASVAVTSGQGAAAIGR